VLHLAHSILVAHWYPNHIFDADLLAYCLYFRNWLNHDTALHGVSYFMLPKPLLVFTLGPLATASLASYCRDAALPMGAVG
jgi:hypothetical protein